MSRNAESIAAVLERLRFGGEKLTRVPLPPPKMADVRAVAISTELFRAARRAREVGMDRASYVRLAELAFDVAAEASAAPKEVVSHETNGTDDSDR